MLFRVGSKVNLGYSRKKLLDSHLTVKLLICKTTLDMLRTTWSFKTRCSGSPLSWYHRRQGRKEKKAWQTEELV